jgi:hypothetical protein
VIEEAPGYNIVKKHSGEPAEIAKATDPRN